MGKPVKKLSQIFTGEMIGSWSEIEGGFKKSGESQEKKHLLLTRCGIERERGCLQVF